MLQNFPANWLTQHVDSISRLLPSNLHFEADFKSVRIDQILELLRGKESAEAFVNSSDTDLKGSDCEDDDDLIFEFGYRKQWCPTLLDADSTIISSTRAENSRSSANKVQRLKFKDYLREQLD